MKRFFIAFCGLLFLIPDGLRAAESGFLFLKTPSDACLSALASSDLFLSNGSALHQNFSFYSFQPPVIEARLNSFINTFGFYQFQGMAAGRLPAGAAGLQVRSVNSADEYYQGAVYNTLYQGWELEGVYASPVFRLAQLGLSAHAGMKGVFETVADQTAWALGFSAGLTLEILPSQLYWGAALSDAGYSAVSSTLPMTFRSGIKYLTMTNPLPVWPFLDAASFSAAYGYSDGQHSAMAGAEAALFRLLTLRLGLRLPFDTMGQAGLMALTAGAGVHVDQFSVDLAYIPPLVVDRHEVLLTLGWRMNTLPPVLTNPLPRPVKVPAAVTIEKARAEVLKGNRRESIRLIEDALREEPDNEDLKEMLLILKSANIQVLTNRQEEQP